MYHVSILNIFNLDFRDALKRNYNLGHYWVEINIEDLSSYDEVLAEKLYKKPTEHLPILEEAAKEASTPMLYLHVIIPCCKHCSPK